MGRTKVSNEGESEQLKKLVELFKDALGPELISRSNPEIVGSHVEFTFIESIKSENSHEILEKIPMLSDMFVPSGNGGYFKHQMADCEVFVRKAADSIDLIMLTVVSEDCDDDQEIRTLGESCRSAFMDAIETVQRANKIVTQ